MTMKLLLFINVSDGKQKLDSLSGLLIREIEIWSFQEKMEDLRMGSKGELNTSDLMRPVSHLTTQNTLPLHF